MARFGEQNLGLASKILVYPGSETKKMLETAGLSHLFLPFNLINKFHYAVIGVAADCIF